MIVLATFIRHGEGHRPDYPGAMDLSLPNDQHAGAEGVRPKAVGEVVPYQCWDAKVLLGPINEKACKKRYKDVQKTIKWSTIFHLIVN